MFRKNKISWKFYVFVVCFVILVGVLFYQTYSLGTRIGEEIGNQTGYAEGFVLGQNYGAYALIDYMYHNNATTTYQDKLCGCFVYGGNESGTT